MDARFRVEFLGPDGICHVHVIHAPTIFHAKEKARWSAVGVSKVYSGVHSFRILDDNGELLVEEPC